jgi:predicted phage terminase large subunit-like protein
MILENKATGQSLIQDLAIEKDIHIKKYKPNNNKITRFAATIPFFEFGRILLPENSPWLNVFLQKLMAFPNSKNDDVIDLLRQFVNVMKSYKNTVPRIRRL